MARRQAKSGSSSVHGELQGGALGLGGSSKDEGSVPAAGSGGHEGGKAGRKPSARRPEQDGPERRGAGREGQSEDGNPAAGEAADNSLCGSDRSDLFTMGWQLATELAGWLLLGH